MKERIHIEDVHDHIGEEVTLAGWVHNTRDHGKVTFIDLRDATGIVQMVSKSGQDVHETVDDLRREWVIKVTGEVSERPDSMVNKDEPLGDVEITIADITVLNESETPPIDIYEDGYELDEKTRLKYRYLDLRRPRLQTNLRERSQMIKYIRDFLVDRDFTAVETPLLGKRTPEGARDFVVPDRSDPGTFFALPQSPQQYKQLLMAGGIDRYFQIAKCLRDEDARKDRQPEFTQLDLEMSFVDREEVMNLNETLLLEIVQELYPDKTVKAESFPRLTHKQALEQYGTDRPDLRENKDDPDELAFCWVVDFPFFESAENTEDVTVADAEWTFTHNPFSRPVPEDREDLVNQENIGDITTTQYDIVLNGYEIGGGSIRAHKPEELQAVLEIIGYNDEEITDRFGHMLKALACGAPPHGGIAWGLDRLVSLLTEEPNIREVMAFPKTREGKDPMMGAPSEIAESHLDELGLEIATEESEDTDKND